MRRSESVSSPELQSNTHAERNRRRSVMRSEEHTSELQSRSDLVCRLLLEKKINHRGLWGEFQLARADLVPHQFPAGRGAPEIPPVLWRRFPGRIPGRLRHATDARAGGAGTLAAAHHHLFA